MSFLFFKTLESYRLYPDLSIRVKQLGSSRRRFDASTRGTRQSRFTFCRVPCKIHVGGLKKEERTGKQRLNFIKFTINYSASYR